MSLNARQERFIELYLQNGGNATQAYIDAGYKARGDAARTNAARLLTHAHVAARLEHRRAEVREAVEERTEITVAATLERLWDQANADPNELVELRRVCCRYCWGQDHRYQRTPRELDAALAAHAKLQAKWKDEDGPVPEFDFQGGVGYDRRRDPHPDCPECHGFGEELVLAKDTRHLSRQARRLYAGVKATQHGLEVKTRDQDAALVNVAKHLGMFVDRVEQQVSGGIEVTFVHE